MEMRKHWIFCFNRMKYLPIQIVSVGIQNIKTFFKDVTGLGFNTSFRVDFGVVLIPWVTLSEASNMYMVLKA